jgi:CrcB protein
MPECQLSTSLRYGEGRRDLISNLGRGLERYLMVMIGAALGGMARYGIGTTVMQWYGGRFPLGTLVINVSGCFLIGMLMTIFTERVVHENWRLLLVVGVLGGYTTFSSFGWETYQSIREGSLLRGLANIMLSVVFGYLAVWIGALLARR